MIRRMVVVCIYMITENSGCCYLISHRIFLKLKTARVLPTQPAFRCLTLTIETLEQGEKYVQS